MTTEPSRLTNLFRAYWTRGTQGRPTPPNLVRTLYLAWLVALALKVLGSSWDVSWHFKWQRDDLAPPHLLDTAGTALVVALVIVHGYTGYGVDRRTLRLMQWGTAIFLIALPLDVINHRVNGLDITTWSPSHGLLYLGTALMIAGAITGWARLAEPGRRRSLWLGMFWLFFLENIWFPNQQQEYGVLELASWDRGSPYAEPSLLKFAADQIGHPVDRTSVLHFALPMPSWVYPVWGCVAAILTMVLARQHVGRRWTATVVASVFVAYRCVTWSVLVGTGFPPSALPFFLVVGGLAVDLTFLLPLAPRTRAVIGSVLITVVTYGALWIQGQLAVTPPIAYRSVLPAALLLAASWLGALWLADHGRVRSEALAGTASPAR